MPNSFSYSQKYLVKVQDLELKENLPYPDNNYLRLPTLYVALLISMQHV